VREGSEIMISLCIALAIAFVCASVYAACLWHERANLQSARDQDQKLIKELDVRHGRFSEQNVALCKDVNDLRGLIQDQARLKEENEMLAQALADAISKGKPRTKRTSGMQKASNVEFREGKYRKVSK
jgi:hypothetical protein